MKGSAWSSRQLGVEDVFCWDGVSEVSGILIFSTKEANMSKREDGGFAANGIR